MRKYSIWAIPLIILVASIFQIACNSGVTTPPVVFDASHPPSGFTWQVGNERIILGWGAVPFAEGYRVYLSREGVPFKLWSGGSPITQNQVILADLSNNVAYYVGVSAVGTNGVETDIAYPGGSPTAVPLIPTTIIADEFFGVPPAPPKNLQGLAGDMLVHLDWDYNTEPDFDRYQVYVRRESSSNYSTFPTVRTNSFDHDDAENGVTYFYKVRAIDLEDLVSGDSNIVHYTPQSAPPLTPTNFTANYIPVDGIVLNWDLPHEFDIAKYRIIRLDVTDPDIDPLLDTLIVTVQYPTDPILGLIPPMTDVFFERNRTYRYELTAIDLEGQYGAPAVSADIEVPAA